MGTNAKMVRNMRMMLVGHTPRMTPRETPRRTQQQPRRAQRQPWETLVGWGIPDTFDDFLGIEVWSKKRKPNAKPTGRRAAARQPWEDYTCELGRYCDVIPDTDVFIADSLPRPKSQVKVTQESGQQAEGQAGEVKKDGAGEKEKEATSDNVKGELNTNDATQKKELTDSKDLTNGVEGQPSDGVPKNTESTETVGKDTNYDISIKDSETQAGSHEPNGSNQGSASVNSFGNKKVIDMSINHLYLDNMLYNDLSSRFVPREQIVREAAAGLVKLPLVNSSRSETAPKPAPPKPQPVRLCYTQSNIRLQRSGFMEEESQEEDEEEGEEESSRLTLPLDDLVSDAGSWSDASDPDDYPPNLVPDRNDLESNGDDDDPEDDLDEAEELEGQWPQLSIRSHTPASARSQKDTLVNSKANTPSDVTARLSSAGHGKAYVRRRGTSGRLTSLGGESDPTERKPVSLVLKTMVLDALPSVQPSPDTFTGSRTKSAKSRSKSSKSRSKSARSGLTNSEGKDLSTTTQFVTRSVDGRLGVTLPTEPLTVLQGLGQYSNPYKERLATRGLPIGDLLPAVDTSLKTNLAARKTPKRYEEPSTPGWRGRSSLSRDMSVTGKDTLLPYEDSLILMREGVEMLRMRENTTVLGTAGFRAVSTRTPLHRAQENVHKRLYGQLGSTRDLTRTSPPADQENAVLTPSLPGHGRWSSSTAALYSAPPRLGYVPKVGETPVQGSPLSSPSARSPPPAPPTAGNSNTLSSLYKLSRRRKTRQRSRETEAGRAAPKLKPPVTKSRPPPAGTHFRELAQLRT